MTAFDQRLAKAENIAKAQLIFSQSGATEVFSKGTGTV